MEELSLARPQPVNGPIAFTLRDIVAVGFRRRRLILLTFLGIFLGAIVVAVAGGAKYEAQMKILVRHRRVDPVVSTTPESASVVQPAVSEEEINSEVELIKSHDLIEQVAADCGLDKVKRHFWSNWFPAPEALRLPKAVARLSNEVKVEPVRKSNLIDVTYRSTDPRMAARVLQTLGNLYLQKHMAVNHPPGQFDFFNQQAEQYRRNLADAEERLVNFGREQAVAAQSERDILLQKVNDLEVQLTQNQAAIAAQTSRIQALEKQVASTPPRLATQARTSDNGALQEQLKATLLTLQLKRTDLVAKYDPSYRLVQEVDAQIAQTKDAIAAAEKAPVREDTTDQNPTYQWLAGELAKARADLPTLKANAEATATSIRAYRAKILSLDEKGIEQQDLTRTAKADEGNYLLYLNKREEARIADEMDNRRIENVVVAEAATVPALPINSPWMVVLVGGLLASFASAGLAFAAEYLDPSFRTPDEVKEYLNVPVFAAIPREDRTLME